MGVIKGVIPWPVRAGLGELEERIEQGIALSWSAERFHPDLGSLLQFGAGR